MIWLESCFGVWIQYASKHNTCKKRNPKIIYLFVVEKLIVMMCVIIWKYKLYDPYYNNQKNIWMETNIQIKMKFFGLLKNWNPSKSHI
jgi:hypothetical protein